MSTDPKPKPKPKQSSSDAAWDRVGDARRSGRGLGRETAMLALDQHPARLYAAMLAFRQDLDPANLEALRAEVERQRKLVWVREHRLALALQVLDAAQPLELIAADGVPTDDLPTLTAEVRGRRQRQA